MDGQRPTNQVDISLWNPQKGKYERVATASTSTKIATNVAIADAKKFVDSTGDLSLLVETTGNLGLGDKVPSIDLSSFVFNVGYQVKP